MRMSWSVTGSCALLVLTVLCTEASAAQPGAPPARTVEDAFKNIKALSGTPAISCFPPCSSLRRRSA
jgi:hypothetical protein